MEMDSNLGALLRRRLFIMVKLSIFDGFCDDEAADDEERYVSHITHGCSHNTWMCFFFPRGMCLAKQQASKSEEEENRKLEEV